MMDVTRLNQHIGKKIEERRKDAMYSQQKLADELSISRSSLANIENGRHQCSLIVLFQICKALNIETGDVLPTKEYVFGSHESMSIVDHLVKVEKISKADAKKIEKYL